MARVSGWLAHRLEQLIQNRIIRPAYFELVPEKSYVPIEER
jgi:citrate synthase